MVGRPAKWVSAHRKNEFKYRLPQAVIMALSDNGDGTTRITVSGSYTGGLVLVTGERVFIPSIGAGFGKSYIATVISGTQFDINETWTTTLSAGFVWLCRLPEVQLYGGWEVGELIIGGEDISDWQPYILLGKFFPEVGTDGYLTFDVSGYLKSDLLTPYKYYPNSTEENYIVPISSAEVSLIQFTRMKLVIEYTNECELLVCNASITTQELNQKYVNTLRAQQPLQQPFIFSDGSNQNFIFNNLQYFN